eukprot:scaffold22228_cov78-Amphora_coffeaeformis.AAC.1
MRSLRLDALEQEQEQQQKYEESGSGGQLPSSSTSPSHLTSTMECYGNGGVPGIRHLVGRRRVDVLGHVCRQYGCLWNTLVLVDTYLDDPSSAQQRRGDHVVVSIRFVACVTRIMPHHRGRRRRRRRMQQQFVLDPNDPMAEPLLLV